MGLTFTCFVGLLIFGAIFYSLATPREEQEKNARVLRRHGKGRSNRQWDPVTGIIVMDYLAGDHDLPDG
jgi:hypothetical protein